MLHTNFPSEQRTNKSLKAVALSAVLFAAAAAAAPPPPSPPPANLVPLLDAVNAFRARVGVGPIAWNGTHALGAQTWANGCRFVHDPNFSASPGAPRSEIIAATTSGGVDAAGAQTAVGQWEASKVGHREAMLNNNAGLGCGATAGCPAAGLPGMWGPWTFWVCRLN